MAYNKAKEERKWRIWKEAEEKKMRAAGMSEKSIEEIRNFDWDAFHSNRSFYEKLTDDDACLEHIHAPEQTAEIKSVDDFLDSIEDASLFQLIKDEDKLTLQIALWKANGYESKEIAEMCGLSVNAVNFRMWYLRKKIKNFYGASNI